jgi:hypothetical protein
VVLERFPQFCMFSIASEACTERPITVRTLRVTSTALDVI